MVGRPFSDRHRILSKADFYHPLRPAPLPDKRDAPASIEWICPPDSDDSSDPPTDLGTHLDPFGPGSPDRLERQALLIALRVRSLIEGTPVRVKSSCGKWKKWIPRTSPAQRHYNTSS